MIHLGISACFMYEDPERAVFGKKSLSYVENDMLNFACSKEVMPFLIPNVAPDLFKFYLSKMDAFLLQGGADISPKSYGESPIENGRWPGDENRDLYELKIMEHAKEHKKPVLGICRGMQLMNVFYGGTLYQDLLIQKAVDRPHRDADLYDKIHHHVNFKDGSFLQKAYNKNSIEVNTVHHQGVKELGEGLIVEATSEQDELVEAIRHKELPHWGVQWHPEFNHSLDGIVDGAGPILEIFLEMIKEVKR